MRNSRCWVVGPTSRAPGWYYKPSFKGNIPSRSIVVAIRDVFSQPRSTTMGRLPRCIEERIQLLTLPVKTVGRGGGRRHGCPLPT